MKSELENINRELKQTCCNQILCFKIRYKTVQNLIQNSKILIKSRKINHNIFKTYPWNKENCSLYYVWCWTFSFLCCNESKILISTPCVWEMNCWIENGIDMFTTRQKLKERLSGTLFWYIFLLLFNLKLQLIRRAFIRVASSFGNIF